MQMFTEKDIYSLIALPDLHLPYEDKAAVDAVEQFIEDTFIDEWLQLGDFMDFRYASKYTKENLKILSQDTFAADYNYANNWLDRHQAKVRKNNPDALFTIFEGNHDYRVKLVIEKDPRFEGLIELEECLRFADRGILYHPYWTTKEPYQVGKARFIHGHSISKYHAAKTVEDFGHSVFYGHTHSVSSFAKRNFGNHDTIVGQSLGFLADYNLDYIGQTPTNWQHAFGMFYFFPDGFFNYYVIQIFNGRFVAPNGKIYQGRP